MDIAVLLPALVLGLTAALAAFFGRDLLLARYKKDQKWFRDTALRFSPNPINEHAWCLTYYATYALLLAILLGILPYALVAFLFWGVLLFVPGVAVDVLWKRRRKQIDLQLPRAISSMANSIKAGLTLVQAIERLGENAPEPVRTEFKTMANQYSFGSDLETVVRDAKLRLDLQNFNLFASAVLLNREMGGDVAATLQRISRSLDKLHEMRKTVEAHTSEGRTNIKVLLLAPFFMLGLAATVMPDYVKDVFTTPQGYFILLIAALLAGTGVYYAAKITRADI